MKKQFIYAMSAVLVLGAVGCNKSGGSGALATVNGEEISLADFHSYLERKPVVQVAAQGPIQAGEVAQARVVGTLGFQALRDLVERKLLLQLAKDDKLFPTPEDVQKELDFKSKLQPDLVKNLNSQGMTLEQIRQDLQLDLARERILTKGINVTKEDASKFIKDNPQSFSTPAQANMQYMIVNDDNAKKQVDAELKSGKSFGDVAAQYSVAQGARQNKGQFPITVIQQMTPALQALVSKTPELKETDWQAEGEGANKKWVKFYVLKKVDAAPVKIDDTKIEQVRRGLALEKGQQATDLAKRMTEALKKAKVEVMLQSLKDPWKQAQTQLQAAESPKTDTSTSAPKSPAPSSSPVAPVAPGTKK